MIWMYLRLVPIPPAVQLGGSFYLLESIPQVLRYCTYDIYIKGNLVQVLRLNNLT